MVLAAGLGIDDIAFSKTFKNIVSVDPDKFLNSIARYNFDLLKIKSIIRHDLTAEEFLKTNTEKFDLVYIDPDRRTGENRNILLQDTLPNCVELLPELFKISNRIVIKCSPMYDFEMAKKELGNISSFYSISKHGEMKELLIVLNKNADNSAIDIICTDIKNNVYNEIHFKDSNQVLDINKAEKGTYLLEVGVSLLKMRKHHEYASLLQLSLIDKSHAFYFSEHKPENFIGRIFKIIYQMPFKIGVCNDYLSQNNITKANLKVRGLKFNTADLQKKLKIKDGGEDYIFVIPCQGTNLFIHCKY